MKNLKFSKDLYNIFSKISFAYGHLSPVESAGAAGFPSSVQCSRCAGLCVRPTGGDRAFGATCELSAGSSHWAHKSSPAEKATRRKCQPLCRSVVTSFITDMHAYLNLPLQQSYGLATDLVLKMSLFLTRKE